MTDFQEIYTKYFRDVYRYALSISRNETIAEEITQETFFKALTKIDSFDGKCKVLVWLCQIAKNTYLSMYRKDKRLDWDADVSRLEEFYTVEERIFDEEALFAIHRALHGIDEPYKEVFSLRIFGELSFKRIAQLFGKTEAWARVTYHRARLKIREAIQK